jgi:hypothetical protein
VSPTMMRRHDQVVCLVVSLCEDYVLLCEDYRFLLIYVLCEYYMYCFIIFCCMTYFGGSPSGEAAKTGVI